MFYVYVLQSISTNELYFGYTNNLKRRLQEHNKKQVFATQKKAPWSLVYYEAFQSQQDATNREHKLKRFGSSYSQLKKRIKKSLMREDLKEGVN